MDFWRYPLLALLVWLSLTSDLQRQRLRQQRVGGVRGVRLVGVEAHGRGISRWLCCLFFLGHDAQQQVQGLDLAEFLLKEVHPHASTVVMKLDIEGAELKVLPWLLARGALCDVDMLFAEIHGPPMFSEVFAVML